MGMMLGAERGRWGMRIEDENSRAKHFVNEILSAQFASASKLHTCIPKKLITSLHNPEYIVDPYVAKLLTLFWFSMYR